MNFLPLKQSQMSLCSEDQSKSRQNLLASGSHLIPKVTNSVTVASDELELALKAITSD